MKNTNACILCLNYMVSAITFVSTIIEVYKVYYHFHHENLNHRSKQPCSCWFIGNTENLDGIWMGYREKNLYKRPHSTSDMIILSFNFPPCLHVCRYSLNTTASSSNMKWQALRRWTSLWTSCSPKGPRPSEYSTRPWGSFIPMCLICWLGSLVQLAYSCLQADSWKVKYYAMCVHIWVVISNF